MNVNPLETFNTNNITNFKNQLFSEFLRAFAFVPLTYRKHLC